ncbi:MAG: 3-oxoacyl-[acyl-carrier-protein] reductase [Candidatus Zixiibacteriota bacterium]|nr:MAG: 3-oxoacyl-[acyl-carrier-protein] reductase [candidate division Zixibacteria bacterium]
MSAEKKIALVTGGARGIGFAIVERLASDGCAVVIADIIKDVAAESTEKLSSRGIECIAVTGDVSRPDDVESMFKMAGERLGTPDILVNNAGITRDNFLMRMSEQEWDSVLNINLKGSYLCSKAASKGMMKKRWGRIVNISSVVGVMGNAGQANYAASKAGLIGFTKSLAKELAGRNITVNAVAPGYIETEMTENLPGAAKENFLKIIPLKRAGKPGDVAGIVSFLVSDGADYVTGQVIHCDGGMVM